VYFLDPQRILRRRTYGPNAGQPRALVSLGNSIKDLQLQDDPPTLPIRRRRHRRLMPDLHLVPGLWKIDGYGKVQAYLFRRTSWKRGKNFFPFPMTAARQPRHAQRPAESDAVAEWRAYWATPMQLILIGH
jgi:hypothetical protein